MSGVLVSGQRVAVVGAGGRLRTAWELAQRGCAVTVFERSGSIAERASSVCRCGRHLAGGARSVAGPAQELAGLALAAMARNRRASGGFPGCVDGPQPGRPGNPGSFLRRELSLEDYEPPRCAGTGGIQQRAQSAGGSCVCVAELDARPLG